MLLLLSLLAFAPDPPPPAILGRYRFSSAPAWRVALPASVQEASGLALRHGRVLVHGDEEARIAVLDAATGRPVGEYSFYSERGVHRGDFEAIGVYRDAIVLLRSDGDLFIGTPDSSARARPGLTHVRTGLGGRCEFEAMVIVAARDEALLVCKEMYHAERRGDRDVYRVALRGEAPRAALAFTLRGKAVRRVTGLEAFTPSDAVLVGESGHLLLLASHQHALLEVDAAGEPVAAALLPRKRHPQPEGLLLLADGTLLVADEGQRGPATLAAYVPAPAR